MITAKRASRYLLYKCAPVISLVLMATGCVTFVRPDPSWSQPVDLGLTAEAMDDAVVHLGCGTRYNDGKLNASHHSFCEAMAVNIEHMGATVLADWRDAAAQAEESEEGEEEEESAGQAETEAAKAKEVLFRVDYVDRLEGVRACNGWSIFFFIMTASWYPLVCDDPAVAELLFYDGEVFALRERVPLRVTARKYIGIGALPMLFRRWMASDGSEKVGHLVGETVQNAVYRYYFQTKRSLASVEARQISRVEGGKP